MSGYSVLFEAGKAIRQTLFDAMPKDMTDGTEAQTFITVAPPQPEGTPTSASLSLWLYFVSENEHLKNRIPQTDASGQQKAPPLALTLYYLVTPLASGGELDGSEQNAALVLGAALQAFHENPVISLVAPPLPDVPQPGERPQPPTQEELHLSMCRLSVEELTRIWDALDRPYRLSACFKVNVVRIDSRIATFEPLVRKREFITGRLVKEPAG